MSLNEKKPLFVRIEGEKQPNLLPVTASAVGFDFNRDRFVFYHTASDDWTDISPDGVDFVGDIYADNFYAAGVVTASSGFSGSLTRLANGDPYLIAGPGITIESESNGPITISSTGGGGGGGPGDAYWGSSQPGIIFTTGSAVVEGFITASLGLSGSLTRLTDGRSYLIAGDNVTITSESNGPITISALSSTASLPGPTRSLYVSPLGSVTGSGIILAPFASIDAAVLAIGSGSSSGSPYAIVMEPGNYNEPPLTLPPHTTLIGQGGARVTTPSLVMENITEISNVTLSTPVIYMGPDNSVSNVSKLTNVTLDQSTSITVQHISSVVRATGITGRAPVEYAGPPGGGATIVNSNSTYEYTVNVTNVSDYSANANSYLNLNIDNSSTDIVGSTLSGPLTASNGSNLNVVGSNLGALVSSASVVAMGNSTVREDINAQDGAVRLLGTPVSGSITGSNGANINLSAESYPQRGLSLLAGALFSGISIADGDLSGSYPAPSVSRLRGYEVSTTPPVNDQVLTWNGGSSTWTPGAVNLSGTGTAVTGTLSIDHGGTGISSTPVNGQLLIGNSTTSAYNLATLTAGSGISITNGAGTISVGNSGITNLEVTSPLSSSGGQNPIISLGTVGVATGGTGLTQAPTNGQLLIGSGSGYTLGSLTAGPGIMVTNGTGSITITATAGADVTAVTATTPLSSSGGTTPNISLGTVGVLNGGTGLSALPTSGQIAIGNGAGFTLSTLTAGQGITINNTAGSISISANANAPQSIVLNDSATEGSPLVIGTIYIPSARTLSVGSTAFLGGSLVGDVSRLQLVPEGGGSAIAAWQKTGTLGSQALTSGGTISAAGWYDLVLQGTSGSGVAFCKGLYLI
jgi:hypothetical protein